MKLAFLMHPVKEMKASLKFYRENLGLEEAWREGDHTVALKLPGTEVQMMLEDEDEGLPGGGVFIVDSVDSFYEQKKELLKFVKDPVDIPPGRYAIYQDDAGNPIRIIDMTKEG
ncbi:VOC family protein [Thalassobacillus hwangdonensis]|uniref:VOC family protein n=1 Tax=Thalassobacillus hwangdonensis TaxID=546108 RepID=A0ABW3L043_9BACI